MTTFKSYKARILFLCTLFLLTITYCGYAQVGIGTTNPQASLDISSSTNGGVLIAKYALSGNNDSSTVVNPSGGALQIGTLIFNTVNITGSNAIPVGFVYWNGSIWVPITPEPAWQLEGNTITGTDFIGTLNNFPFNIHVNNNKRFGLTSAGQIVPFNSSSAVLIGASTVSSGTNGIAIGNSAAVNDFGGISIGLNSVSDERSVAIGENSNATGAFGISIGPNSNATNIRSISIGATSTANQPGSITLGQTTSATGVNAMALGNLSVATGPSSTSVGDNADALANGATAIGNLARASGTTSTALGDRSQATGQAASAFGENSSATGLKSTAIGSFASVTTDNTIQLGDSGLTTLNCRVPLTVTSDKNYKYNIKNNVPGLDFITKLKPVTYNFNTAKLAKLKNEPVQNQERLSNKSNLETGFLAQDVAELAKKIGYDFNGIHVPEDETKDSYGISYSLFVVPLVKAVQEQQDEISDLKKKIEQLEALIKKKL